MTMKPLRLIALLMLGLLAACGPSEAELRSELQRIESEMLAIELAAKQHAAEMDRASVNAAAGSYSAGYGLTSGEYDTLGDGISVAVEASRDYDVAAYSLEQLGQRYRALDARKAEILRELD